MTHSITLPRFVRDIRQSRPGRAASGTGTVGPWSGVRRPVGGVLNPGVSAGEWPPPLLSHLALGPLLAEATAPSRSTTGEADAGTAAADHAEPAELTVREVIRDAGERAPDGQRTAADPHPPATVSDVRMTSRAAVSGASQTEEPTESEGRSDMRTGGEGRPSASHGDAVAALGAAAPRTVLQAGGGPATVGERRITQVVERPAVEAANDAGGAEAGGAGPGGSPASFEPRVVPGPWPAPVERTVPTMPAAFGALAGGDGPPGWRSGPSRPQVPQGDAARAGDEIGSSPSDTASAPLDLAARTTAGSAPEMTLLERAAAAAAGTETSARGDASGLAGRGAVGPSETGGTETAGATDRDARSETDGAVVSQALEGAADGAVGRVIADAMSQPRVVDRLFHELERRRRIERERGGRR